MPWPALRALRELARLGTIAAVADAHGYTPGAVSQQLAALERAAGQPLLERIGRRVQLTQAGTVLLGHAERMLDAEHAARRALEALADDVSGTLRIATFATSAATLLAPSITRLGARHPALRVMTLELDVDAVPDAVERGLADLAIGLDYPDAPVPRSAGVEVVPLGEERFALAVPPGSPLRGPVGLAGTGGLDWILPPEPTHYGRALRTACRRAGVEPRVVHDVTDTAVSLVMVAQGLGVTAVTDMMLALTPQRPRVVALVEDVRRTLVLIRRPGDAGRPMVRAAQAAVEHVVSGTGGMAPARPA